jgi:hypothetical protein
MKNIYSISLRLMLLSVLFSGVPAFSMLPPMFRFGAKVVGVSGLSAATSVASVMGFDYYKNRQLVFSPDLNQPVMAPIVIPEPSLPIIQDFSQAPTDSFIKKIMSGTVSCASSIGKSIISAACQHPQIAATLGALALGAAGYWVKSSWDLTAVKKQIKDLDATVKKETAEIKVQITKLETDLKKAITDGDQETQKVIKQEIAGLEAKLSVKIEDLKGIVSVLRGVVETNHKELLGRMDKVNNNIADLGSQLTDLYSKVGQMSSNLQEVTRSVATQGKILKDIQASQANLANKKILKTLKLFYLLL